MNSQELQAAYDQDLTPLPEVVARRLIGMVHRYWNKDMPALSAAEE